MGALTMLFDSYSSCVCCVCWVPNSNSNFWSNRQTPNFDWTLPKRIPEICQLNCYCFSDRKKILLICLNKFWKDRFNAADIWSQLTDTIPWSIAKCEEWRINRILIVFKSIWHEFVWLFIIIWIMLKSSDWNINWSSLLDDHIRSCYLVIFCAFSRQDIEWRI